LPEAKGRWFWPKAQLGSNLNCPSRSANTDLPDSPFVEPDTGQSDTLVET